MKLFDEIVEVAEINRFSSDLKVETLIQGYMPKTSGVTLVHIPCPVLHKSQGKTTQNVCFRIQVRSWSNIVRVTSIHDSLLLISIFAVKLEDKGKKDA